MEEDAEEDADTVKGKGKGKAQLASLSSGKGKGTVKMPADAPPPVMLADACSGYTTQSVCESWIHGAWCQWDADDHCELRPRVSLSSGKGKGKVGKMVQKADAVIQ